MTLDEIRALDAAAPMPNPTENDLKDPLFEAIWQVIKSWDVNVPAYYIGYCGANGSHAKLILDAARSLLLPLAERVAELEGRLKKAEPKARELDRILTGTTIEGDDMRLLPLAERNAKLEAVAEAVFRCSPTCVCPKCEALNALEAP